ncbi:MAG: hypothetical protein LUO89_08970, partial [Methanothrix sp.]|nr:hypothetical protein [Methanothrix sp.]
WESHMRSHVKLIAVVAIAVLALILGCGGGPHPYTQSSLTPSDIVAGSSDLTLTLDGANLTKDTRVAFAGATLIPSYFASTQIRVTVPGSAVSKAGIVDVAVTGSCRSRALTCTIKNPLPAVSALSQESILLNSGSFSLDVTGSGFLTTSTVDLGDEPLAPSVVTRTKLTMLIPDAMLTEAQAMPVTVVNPGPLGGTSSAINFTVMKTLIPIAKTDSGEFSDFVYWFFSGRPPNTGGGANAIGVSEGGAGDDAVTELPRWRSSSFIAVAGRQIEAFEVALKTMTGTVDGVYLADGDHASGLPEVKPIQTVIDTTFPGPDIDPEAPAGSNIAAVGMERDGLRSDLPVLTSSMPDAITGESGAGIYITQVMPQ